MQLNFRKYGSGPALIILHGLYGSSDNWISIARELSTEFSVYIPDQRNHGNSPHTDEHTYPALSSDLIRFMEQENIPSASLLGHSMGGKTAMLTSLLRPDKIERLMVADISPRSYFSENNSSPHRIDHLNMISAMRDIDFSKVETRMDVDMMLAKKISSPRVRAFLLKNVKRKDKNSFCWKLNLPVLQKSMPDILDGINTSSIPEQNKSSQIPTLFLKGENSEYITPADYPLIKSLFPRSRIVIIPRSGHWLHAEQPDLFLKNIRYFLEE